MQVLSLTANPANRHKKTANVNFSSAAADTSAQIRQLLSEIKSLVEAQDHIGCALANKQAGSPSELPDVISIVFDRITRPDHHRIPVAFLSYGQKTPGSKRFTIQQGRQIALAPETGTLLPPVPYINRQGGQYKVDPHYPALHEMVTPDIIRVTAVTPQSTATALQSAATLLPMIKNALTGKQHPYRDFELRTWEGVLL